MIRVELVVNATTYYFSDSPLDYADKYWEPRLVNGVSLNRVFSDTEKSGSQARSLNLKLDNRDNFFTSLETSYGLLNQIVTVYFGSGDTASKKLYGTIEKINSFGLEVDVTITESILPYLAQPIPDEQIAYDYYSDMGINDSWDAVPIIFGTARRHKLIPFDYVNNRYGIGSGEIYKVHKVYFDTAVVYDGDANPVVNGYSPDINSNGIKVRIFKGKGWGGSLETVTDEFGSHTSVYPGMAYIEFYDAVTGDPVKPQMTDNTDPEVFVDVSGIVNAGKTDAERNPAQLAYWLLTNPTTARNIAGGGANGWGLGIPVSLVDCTQAIIDSAALGFKVDGIINTRQEGREWVDELAKSCRGIFTEENGKYTLTIDKARGASVATFDEVGENGYHCIVEPWNEPDLSQQINRLKVEFGRNHETGKYDKIPDPASIYTENETHALRINKWNNDKIELPLVQDEVTAARLGQYYFKKKLNQLKTVTVTTEVDIPDALDVGKVVLVNSPKFLWTYKSFTVVEMSKSDTKTVLKLKEYDATVYDYTPVTITYPTPVVPPSVYAIPAKPTNFTVSSTATISEDGSTKITLALSAIKPTVNAQAVVFFRKKVGDSNFSYFTQSFTGNTNYQWDTESGNYYIRAVTLSPTGVYSKIDIISGDTHYKGQPGAETYISITGDLTAPGTPQKPTTTPLFKSIIVECIQNATKAPDLAGFQIWRNTTNDSGTATQVGFQACGGTEASTSFLDETTGFGTDYYYWTKAVDKTGNVSGFSAASGPIRGARILAADILRKLTPADALNTDPYFEDATAWGGDLAGAVADPAHFVTVADGIAGGTEFKTSSGERAVFGVSLDGLAPYDSTRKYVLTAFVRASGGTNGLGFAFYDNAKTLLGTTSAQDSAITATSTWTEFNKTFSSVPDGTRYIGPMFVCNDGTSAGVVVEIQKARLREVLTADILIANEAIITSAIQIAEGIINNAHIANLDAEKITSGILDTARLSAAVAAVSQLTALGKNLIEDPTFLDFQNSFAMSGTATEAVVGRWTIAGDAAIPVNGVGVLTAESKPTLVMTGKGIKLCPFSASSGNRLWMAQNVAVKPNEAYCFSVHVTRDDAVPTDVTPPYDLIIEWRSSAGYLSQVAATNDAPGRFYVSGTAPETASYAILYVMLPAHTPVSGYGANMVVSAVQFERASAATFWVGREQGTVTADRIFTGLLRSLNYSYSSGDFSTAGMMLDLNTGLIRSKKFSIDSNGNAKFSGDISGATGSFSGEVRADGYVIAPTDGSTGLGTIRGGYTGQIKIYISNYAGISDAPSYMVYIKMTLPGTVVELGCSLNVKNGWQNDPWKHVLVGDKTNERLKLRFYKSDQTPYKYYIVIGETTTDWGWGAASIIEAAGAVASISTGSVTGTVQQTLAS